jgi:flavin-dependent dehydrogenase/ribosomal protein S18 acetylase RimI-like enzyme
VHLPLNAGDTIAIIGGGPGGSACAIRLLRESARRGLGLRVVIFEGKDFSVHHNRCVGVLSPPIDQILSEELGVALPQEIVRRDIHGYRLFGPTRNILLVGHGTEPEQGTYAVRRNDFDLFLLETARALGAEVVDSRVTHVEILRTRSIDEVRLYSESISVHATAVVGAFGLDDAMLTLFERATRYRRPPKLLQSYIVRLDTSPAFIRQKLGHIIQAFLLPTEVSSVEFGAITPKDDYVLINIAGPRVSSRDMDSFLRLPRVRASLPPFDPDDLDYYSGWFPTSPGSNVYGRRYALVGDATGWMRPFKGKGINTAILTGVRAAQAMLDHGVAREDLRHYEASCRELLDDYVYGRAVRSLARLTAPYTLDPIVDVATTTPVLYDALHESVSGHATYRDIIRRSASLGLVRRIAARVLGISRRRKGKPMRGKQVTVRRMTVRDIDAIMRIDEQITGEPHAAFLESAAAEYIARESQACLVAEDRDGRVIGFLLAGTRGWAYGVERYGWLDAIGVEPGAQGQGVSRMLLDELVAYLKGIGVKSVQTMVNWNDGGLVDYFRANGFERAEFVNLVKEI